MTVVSSPSSTSARPCPGCSARMPAGYEPIVVDNGSTDGSGALAAQLGAHGRARAARRVRRRLLRRPARGARRRRLLHGLRRVASTRGDLPAGGRSGRGGRGRPRARRAAAAPGRSHARIANRALALELRRRTGARLTDLGPMRAARREPLLALGDPRPPLRLAAGDGPARRGRRLADPRGRRRPPPARGALEGDGHASAARRARSATWRRCCGDGAPASSPRPRCRAASRRGSRRRARPRRRRSSRPPRSPTRSRPPRVAAPTRRVLVLDGEPGAVGPARLRRARRSAATAWPSGSPRRSPTSAAPPSWSAWTRRRSRPALLDAGLRRARPRRRRVRRRRSTAATGASGCAGPTPRCSADVPMSAADTGGAPARAARGARPAHRRAARRCATSTRSPTPARVAARGARAARFAGGAGGMIARIDRPRRRRRRSSTGACWRPRRSTCSAAAPPRARPRALGRRDAASRCRSTAGSALADAADAEVLDAGRRPPCSTSAAARAATSPRCGRAARPRSASTSPPSLCASRAGAARPRSPATCSATVPHAGRWRDRAAAGRQRRHRRRARRAAAAHARAARARRRGARRARPAGRADRSARGIRIEAGGEVSEWFRWARVGVDGIEPLAARAGLPRVEVVVCAADAGSRVLRRP